MTFDDAVRRTGKAFRKNSPILLSSSAVAGVLTTAYLSARAGYQAAEIIWKDEGEHGPSHEERNERLKRRVRLTWKLYVPPAGASIIAIACVVGSARVSGRRVAAANTAYSISAAAFEQYRGKVAELLGTGKEQAVRDELARERIASNPPPPGIVVGSGKVFCCELFTGRYFECDMETLRRAENKVNARLVREMYCMLTEFYWEVGLPVTTQSSEVGWESDKHLELRYSTVLTEGKPCLAFEYNYVKPL